MDNQAIAKISFDLLAREPTKGGLTIQLTGGGPDIVMPSLMRPSMDPAMGTTLLASLGAAGVFRSAEVRSQFNLQVFAEEQDGQYNVRIERVTGMSVLTSIPDPSEVITHFQAGSLAEAEEMLARALGEHFPNVELNINRLSYRTSSFAQCALDEARGKPPGRFSIPIFRLTDTALAGFVTNVVKRALAWGPTSKNADSLSIRFHSEDGRGAIYATITPEGRRFKVEVEDRIVWPWKKKAVSASFRSAAEVQTALADYVERTHGFQVHNWSVDFNHTVKQDSTDLDAWV